MNRRKAAFPVDKRLVEFDWHQSTIKRQVNQLLDFRFIDENLHRSPPASAEVRLALLELASTKKLGFDLHP